MTFDGLNTHRDPITGLNVISIKDIEAEEGRSSRTESPASSPPKPAPVQKAAIMPQATKPAPISDAQVIALWDMRVEKEMQSGKSKADATRAVASADQKLHQQYLAAYKAEVGRGRRPGAARR